MTTQRELKNSAKNDSNEVDGMSSAAGESLPVTVLFCCMGDINLGYPEWRWIDVRPEYDRTGTIFHQFNSIQFSFIFRHTYALAMHNRPTEGQSKKR